MDDNKEEFPTIKEQGKSLAKFTFEVVKDSVFNLSPGEVFASDELKKERLDTVSYTHLTLPTKRIV